MGKRNDEEVILRYFREASDEKAQLMFNIIRSELKKRAKAKAAPATPLLPEPEEAKTAKV